MKEAFVERLTYANSKQHSAVQAENVPPIIAPLLAICYSIQYWIAEEERLFKREILWEG